MHRTDTHDVAFVIRGSAELLPQDGSSTELYAGDVFVMPCTVHGIRVDPDSVVLTGIAIGIGRPEPCLGSDGPPATSGSEAGQLP
jgi:quercetin dioxygenase-like cupin family protein